LSTRTRTDIVYEAVISKLMDGRLPPGALVQRRQLAAELGVSISPVNEAVFQLELEGLLETIPRKGTRVRSPSQREVWSLLIARMAIEAQAVRMICGAPLQVHETKLRTLAEAVDAHQFTGPLMSRADVAFHRALVAVSDCPSLTWHFDRLMRQGLILLRTHSIERRPASSHLELLERLLNSGPEEAEDAIRHHIQSGKAAIGLDRCDYAQPRRPRMGHSPMSAQHRMGGSMERLLARTEDA
jgi:DNA-binding GntR family transcriptional regulator